MAPLVRLRAARLESPRNGTGGAGGYLQVGAYNWVASPTTPVVYDKNTVTAGNGGSGTGTGSTGGNGTTWTQSSGNATDGWATANPTTGDVTSTTVTLSNGVATSVASGLSQPVGVAVKRDDAQTRAIPHEIQALRFENKTTLSWDSEALYAGSAIRYDLLAGKHASDAMDHRAVVERPTLGGCAHDGGQGLFGHAGIVFQRHRADRLDRREGPPQPAGQATRP